MIKRPLQHLIPLEIRDVEDTKLNENIETDLDDTISNDTHDLSAGGSRTITNEHDTNSELKFPNIDEVDGSNDEKTNMQRSRPKREAALNADLLRKLRT